MTTVTDTDETPEESEQTSPTPGDVIRAFGYDPAAVQALIITADTVVAVDAQYPEPITRQE